MDKIQKAVLDAVSIVLNNRLKELGYSYYIDGVIQSVNPDGTYNVSSTSGDLFRNLKARTGLKLSAKNIVQICVRNGDFSRKFIDDFRLC